MLKTRVLTALVLLAILLPILYFRHFGAFALVALVFFFAASWESARLFGFRRPLLIAVVWSALIVVAMLNPSPPNIALLFVLCVALWAIRFVPALRTGLPVLASLGNNLLGISYGMAIFGCFIAIATLFLRSPLYLLSVMALVWLADIGAYFCGKAWGRRKLAPSISPGKSWEGAIGGWLVVLLVAAGSAILPSLQDTFSAQVQQRWGWAIWFVILSLLVAASVVGDLFESQLKRRAGFKDSSTLLPGHGGVLDRIDALIPVLPLAALLTLSI
ncbi:phosphatidate cytidylyltransferase [Herbaspirillum sp. RTI4]|uniref:phosphatidate cytidylyltransferase n=1 Tax=Herbaspirillum sp. RTI4 TaxID=3048640 RepID=UPI002AB3B780|nr:phosphatidate cytidylyltransferase [Herbaspirillum sp. RTI4]MDY7578695.1 phosphatidate cytidylyltransferase [Herbaspirillum sp. RTI4]MEA9980607.1 phosphatidate cytidylyltransferase [Herbaspirillum sp. RTI4]